MPKIIISSILCLFIVSCSTGNVNYIGKNRLSFSEKKDNNTEYTLYENWNFAREGNRCYIFSFPVGSSGNYESRNIHYLMINYNPVSKTNEIAIIGGREYKKDSFVRMQLGDVSYLLPHTGTEAWANDENIIIDKMLNSNADILVFSDFEKHDKKSLDKYSLLGFHRAYETLQDVCR